MVLAEWRRIEQNGVQRSRLQRVEPMDLAITMSRVNWWVWSTGVGWRVKQWWPWHVARTSDITSSSAPVKKRAKSSSSSSSSSMDRRHDLAEREGGGWYFIRRIVVAVVSWQPDVSPLVTDPWHAQTHTLTRDTTSPTPCKIYCEQQFKNNTCHWLSRSSRSQQL